MAQNATQSAAIVEYKQINMTTLTLSDGAVITSKLPSQMLWTGLMFDLTGTLNISVATPVQARDGILNLISRLQLRCNGRPWFDIPFAQAVYRAWYYMRGKQAYVDPGTSTGSFMASLYVPFNLPYPCRSPGNFGTVLPAGLLNNIELQVTCPSTLVAANFSNVNGATITYTNGPVLTVSAIAADVGRSAMLNVVNQGGHGYVQNNYLQPIAGTGDLDQDLQGGSGILKDLFVQTVNNSVNVASTAANFVTNVRLLVGNNIYPVDSTWQTLQNRGRSIYGIPNADLPTGSWMYSFNQQGDFMEGIDLRRMPSVKLRSTISTAVTSVAQQQILTGILVPELLKQVL